MVREIINRVDSSWNEMKSKKEWRKVERKRRKFFYLLFVFVLFYLANDSCNVGVVNTDGSKDR